MKSLARFCKVVGLLLAVMFCGSMLLGVSSCEKTADNAVGVNPDNGAVDASGGTVGTVITAAKNLLPPPFNTILGFASLAVNGLQYVLSARLKKAQNATATGLQAFVNAQAPAIGQALLTALDSAHDNAGVHPALQDAIQPTVKTQ